MLLRRLLTFAWAALVVGIFGFYLLQPEAFTAENFERILTRWGPWAFPGFVLVSLLRGPLLVPSTPVVLAGGAFFPEALPAVLVVSSDRRLAAAVKAAGGRSVGAGGFLTRFVPDDSKKVEEAPSPIRDAVRKMFPFGGSPALKVKGSDDLMTYLAKCCNPLPGEKIVGYVTRGKGIAVHSDSCPNVRNLMFNPDREIEVEWGEKEAAQYRIDLEVQMEDRTGMLARVVSQIANMKTNIRNIEARTTDGRGVIDLTVEISDLRHLEKVLKGLSNLDGVIAVERKYNARQASA